jgi:hypothetical protein
MVAVDTGGRADPGPLNAIPTNPRTVPETLNATGLFFLVVSVTNGHSLNPKQERSCTKREAN